MKGYTIDGKCIGNSKEECITYAKCKLDCGHTEIFRMLTANEEYVPIMRVYKMTPEGVIFWFTVEKLRSVYGFNVYEIHERKHL